MVKSVNWKVIGIHAAGCFSFLLLPILFNPRPTDLNFLLHNFRTLEEAITYLLLLAFFYVNYYWLIPSFYFNRKRIYFIVLVVLCFITIAFVPDWIFEGMNLKPIRPSDVPQQGQRVRPIIGLFQFGQSLFLFLIVFFFSIMLRVTMRLRQTEKEKLSAEVSFLKAQINPHFLFNTLNGIYSMALQKSGETANVVVKLSNLMRYVVTEASEDFVPIDKEFSYLKNYIELQQIRFGSSLIINYDVAGDTYGKSIAPLIIMPLIENAFKYGVSPEEESSINIKIEIALSTMTFHITNKKVLVQNVEKTGLGLQNVRKRLELIYSGRHELIIKEEENIFDVTLFLF